MSKHLESWTYQDTKKNFDNLFSAVSSQRFLQMNGLGNEVPFFIFPYPSINATDIEPMKETLVKKLDARDVGILEINLYDLGISLLKDRGIWDDVIASEPDVSKDELRELLQNVLDPETHLVPAIGRILSDADYDVLFLIGIGEVFPYIRSHNVLNNLQSTAKEKPTIMFFPGSYTHNLATGASLDLFGFAHNDKYYRAFNILDYRA
jgi:bacteriophage exclusion system BrxB-like protein